MRARCLSHRARPAQGTREMEVCPQARQPLLMPTQSCFQMYRPLQAMRRLQGKPAPQNRGVHVQYAPGEETAYRNMRIAGGIDFEVFSRCERRSSNAAALL